MVYAENVTTYGEGDYCINTTDTNCCTESEKNYSCWLKYEDEFECPYILNKTDSCWKDNHESKDPEAHFWKGQAYTIGFVVMVLGILSFFLQRGNCLVEVLGIIPT